MQKKSNTETVVGIFLLMGVGVLCTLILFFGQVEDLFKPTYTITVKFPNASGLLKGSDVFLSGAHIGKVITDPTPIPDTEKVEVKLKIDNAIKIRDDAQYVIGSSGLLGDLYVEVKPHEYPKTTAEKDKKPYISNGAVIEGDRTPGFNDLAAGAKPLIESANHIAAQLDDMITRLNKDVLSNTSTDDLKETIATLRQMVNKGNELMDNGNAVMKNANELMLQAKNGKGVIGRLITDKKMGQDLANFVSNLKEHGPIFYADDSAEKPEETPAPRKRK